MSIATGAINCWIGLNDIDNEGTFVWVDGSSDTFRYYNSGEPNGGTTENCVHTSDGFDSWNDLSCVVLLPCYFCSTDVNVFGELIASTYSALSNNAILTSDTTLYCVTENLNTPEVMWSYVDLSGIRTDLSSTTDPNTGVSTIQVYTTQPGYHSCDVTESGGMSRTYTAIMLSQNLYAAVNGYNYSYTVGVDSEDIYLNYIPTDNSVLLTDIYWRIQGLSGLFTNPLNINSLTSYIGDANFVTLYCYDIESGNIFISVALSVQGSPLIQLGNEIINSFSLLPPNINRADVTVLSEVVVLTTNLVGRWQRPNGTYGTQSSLIFDIFQQSDEGLYKLYVTNWGGSETLAIQIYITAVESTLSLTNLRTENSGENSILVVWGLSETYLSYSGIVFSIYLGIAGFDTLAGITTFLYYEIDDLQGDLNYTIRVEFEIPFSTETVSATTYHFLEPIVVTTPTNNITQSTGNPVINPTNSPPIYYVIVIGIVIIISLLLLVSIIAIIVCCLVQRHASNKTATSQTNPRLFELPANETYHQDVNVNIAYSPEKKIDLGIEKSPLEISSPNDHSM
ncbi:Lactose-binding lectin l-2-like [Oopsacas minuta]|uniref:Lactose-binding lectin l-2-like n=1 Tax=Oopsacas minuta TaxID=111878 RepID=A0AAV7KD00_9METZ|nr:Lactose-binding lectin l-2-like [Oopsacas minuta]